MAINDHVAALAARHPGRVLGLASVDAYDGERAAREAERAIRELRLLGLFVDCARGDLLIDAPQARPTLEVAAKLGVPVFVHPVAPQPLTKQMIPYGLIHKVAPYYYYPGWWEGGATIHNFINLDKWNQLTPTYQAIIRAASELANSRMQAKYDASNPSALKRLVAAGAELRPFSLPVLEACLAASNEVSAEIAATNPEFKKVSDNMTAFRNDQYL